MRIAVLLAALATASGTALAATPEIQRPVGSPQANGVTHTVRGLPEACAFLQGTFTGDAAVPYRLSPVRSSPTCQPRARLVDAAKAKPSERAGWKLNDVIRVPSKDCPGQQAVVEVWRKPSAAAGLQLVDQLVSEPSLKAYHLLPAVRGDFLVKLGRLDEARAELERAASLTQNARERGLLLERAAACARDATRASA